MQLHHDRLGPIAGLGRIESPRPAKPLYVSTGATLLGADGASIDA